VAAGAGSVVAGFGVVVEVFRTVVLVTPRTVVVGVVGPLTEPAVEVGAAIVGVAATAVDVVAAPPPSVVRGVESPGKESAGESITLVLESLPADSMRGRVAVSDSVPQATVKTANAPTTTVVLLRIECIVRPFLSARRQVRALPDLPTTPR